MTETKRNDRFAERLLAVEPVAVETQQQLQQELQKMFVRELGRPTQVFMCLVAVVALTSAVLCGFLAATEPTLPPLARGGLAVGVLFGLGWAIVAGRVALRRKLDLRIDGRRMAAMVWIFTTLMMVFFLAVGMTAKDKLLGLMLIANGLVFLIGAAVYFLSFRIEQAELNTQERLLQLELQIAQSLEKLGG